LEEKFCGVWGHMEEEYLRTTKPRLYNLLLEKGELEEYLTSYQKAYCATCSTVKSCCA